ncbi:MAG: opacity protein-like surface antigen [Saprospiraceae bacterium]|jgi:opacity protein-like surface antigen
MKLIKLVLILVMVSLFQIMNAQDESSANPIVIGGSLNFLTQNNTYPFSSLTINSGIGGIYSNSTNQTKNFTFSISPYIGKELNQNWLLGIELDYRIGNYKAEDTFVFGQLNTVDFERKSNQIGIGIIIRYILNPEDQFNFYLQPYVEYNILNEEESQDSNVTQEEKANYIELGIGGGILYNINDTWRATIRIGGLNYVNGSWEIVDTDTGNDFSSFGTNLNFSSIRFGIEMKL